LVEYRPEEDSDSKYVREYLRTSVVNPLRKRFYVESKHVVHLRTTMGKWLCENEVSGISQMEKFLNVLFEYLYPDRPYIHLHSSAGSIKQNTVVLQLAQDSNGTAAETVQYLLLLTLATQNLLFEIKPNSLILKIPKRAGTKLNQDIQIPFGTDEIPYILVSVLSQVSDKNVCFARSTGYPQWYIFDGMYISQDLVNIPCVREMTQDEVRCMEGDICVYVPCVPNGVFHI
jgi:hypothetical protein